MRPALIGVIAILAWPLLPGNTHGCMRVGPISVLDMCRRADAIVRVRALDYISPPDEEGYFTSGIPRSTLRILVEEVLSGAPPESILSIRGYLSDEDDFNDHPVPYQFVRPGGRKGSCYANSYRRNGQFILFLAEIEGELTPYWYVLGPVNEQVTDENDPWVWWLKGYIAGLEEMAQESESK